MALNLALISKKSPILCFVICFEINTASITNTAQLQNGGVSYRFMFSLKNLTFYWKKILTNCYINI